MTESVSVTLDTVLSTWTSPFQKTPLEQPYRRVVRVRRGVGKTQEDHWSRINPAIPESAYNRNEVTPEVITMKPYLAERLVSFFCHFFVEDPRTKPQYDRVTGTQVGNLDEAYNCHRFGYWMRGTPAAQDFNSPAAPDHVTEGFAINGNLPMGRHGVLGTRGAAVHSVVGLGEDRNECLQVTGTGGFLGIDTYEHVVDQYDYMRTAGMQIFL